MGDKNLATLVTPFVRLIVGEGKALFAATGQRRGLELRKVEQVRGGRVNLTYAIG